MIINVFCFLVGARYHQIFTRKVYTSNRILLSTQVGAGVGLAGICLAHVKASEVWCLSYEIKMKIVNIHSLTFCLQSFYANATFISKFHKDLCSFSNVDVENYGERNEKNYSP